MYNLISEFLKLENVVFNFFQKNEVCVARATLVVSDLLALYKLVISTLPICVGKPRDSKLINVFNVFEPRLPEFAKNTGLLGLPN
jgi:hypothetical protein